MQSLTVSNKSNVIVHSTVEWEYHMSMVFIYKVLKMVGNFFLGWARCGVGAVWTVKDKAYCIVWVCSNRPGKSLQFGSEVEINKISEDMWLDRGWSGSQIHISLLARPHYGLKSFFCMLWSPRVKFIFFQHTKLYLFFYLHTNFNL